MALIQVTDDDRPYNTGDSVSGACEISISMEAESALVGISFLFPMIDERQIFLNKSNDEIRLSGVNPRMAMWDESRHGTSASERFLSKR